MVFAEDDLQVSKVLDHLDELPQLITIVQLDGMVDQVRRAVAWVATHAAQFGGDAPMQRAGEPDEIAPCYVFLASRDASYMTGQVLHPNGGEIVNGQVKRVEYGNVIVDLGRGEIVNG